MNAFNERVELNPMDGMPIFGEDLKEIKLSFDAIVEETIISRQIDFITEQFLMDVSRQEITHAILLRSVVRAV